MFLHASEEGQKEAERFIHQGHQHGLPRLNPEADVPVIQLVGYWTSQKENPRPLPQSILTKKVTWPSALWAPTDGRGHPRHPVFPEEPLAETTRHHHAGGGPMGTVVATPWSSHRPESQSRSWGSDYPHNEALWKAREAHQWALEATHMLELNIERLTQGVESIQHWCPHSCSSSCHQSKSLDRCERSLSWHRPERHVTFCDPEVEMPSSKRLYREPWGYLTRAQLERGNVGPLCIWRPEMVHPQVMPMT